MLANKIGKKIVDLYNQKNGTTHTCETFFNKVFAEVALEKHACFFSATNTPFGPTSPIDGLDDRLKELKRKILDANSTGTAFRQETAVIGGSGNHQIGSKSQFEEIYPIPIEDIYAIWIGQAFGLMTKGGLIIYIDNDKILNTLFDGWFKYKEFVKHPDKELRLQQYKIHAWNSLYLSIISFHSKFDEIHLNDKIASREGKLEITTIPWGEMIYHLSNFVDNDKEMIYICSTGQLNTTIGWVQINLKAQSSIKQTFITLFGKEHYTSNLPELIRLYGSEFSSIDRAIIQGTIGLKSFKIRYTEREKKNKLIYQLYKSWVMELIKNNNGGVNILELSDNLTKALISYGKSESKTNKSDLIKNFLNVRNKRMFFSDLGKLSSKNAELANIASNFRADFERLTNESIMYLMILTEIEFNKENYEN